uniref:G-protein coupled receptors family 1 profile domain-containing protein n=1 Tax=Glossina brevipalpis TaxID=37001 RepID=A0A1A9WQ24_9MUSC
MNISTASSKCQILSTTSEGQCQLYCIRTHSMKSLTLQTNKFNEDDTIVSSFKVKKLSNALSAEHLAERETKGSDFNLKRQPQQKQKQQQQEYSCHQLPSKEHLQMLKKRKLSTTTSWRPTVSALRKSNIGKHLESKKRVVKMLFVLVLEFFICWTPLYIINTMAMFIGPAIYEYVDYTTISFLQLLAYSSSCCNPITYCFMNANFRRAFMDTFKGMHLNGDHLWHKRTKSTINLSMVGNSNTTANTVLESPRL